MAEVIEDILPPFAASLGHVFLDGAVQVYQMVFHTFVVDSMDVYQFLVYAVDKKSVEIEYVSDSPSHTSAKVDPGITEDGNNASGHIFTTMISNAFDYCACSGITYCKAFTGETCGQ